jgi:hypothetical protein
VIVDTRAISFPDFLFDLKLVLSPVVHAFKKKVLEPISEGTKTADDEKAGKRLA